MIVDNQLQSPDDVREWILSHLVKGEGLTRPYRRKWEMGGCSPQYSLWTWPSDRVATLATGLVALGFPVRGSTDGVLVNLPGKTVRVAADKSDRGDGPPEDYVVQIVGGPVNYVGNSPEVIVALLRELPMERPTLAQSDQVQVGFPGLDQTDVVYVGNWQWDIHGEARGSDFAGRAVSATLAAIEDARRRSQ